MFLGTLYVWHYCGWIFSLLRIMFAVGLSYMGFIMLRYVPSMPAFWRGFFLIINGCWILSKAFSASVNHTVLSFNLLMGCITLIDLWILKKSLHPWDKAHLVMMYDLFNMLMDSVCSNFVKDFCIYVRQWYWHVVFFFCVWHLCLVLVLRWWWPHRMSLGFYLPLQFSGRVWVG